MRKLTRIVIGTVLGASVAASAIAATPRQFARQAEDSVPPVLLERLPESTLAYLRIPAPRTLLALPEETVVAGAKATLQYQELLGQLQPALARTLVEASTPELQGLVGLLSEHLRSPLEVVLLPPKGSSAPILNVLVAGRLDVGADELNALLEQAVARHPRLALMQRIDAEGYGMLSLDARPLPIYFAGGEFYLLAGMAASGQVLAQTLNELAQNRNHPLRRMERDFDAGGQGLFFWLDLRPLMPFAQVGMTPEELQRFKTLQLDQLGALALGWGKVGSHPRLRLALQLPPGGIGTLFPDNRLNVHASAAGEPSSVGLLALPSPEQLLAMEAMFAQLVGPERYASYEDGKAEIEAAMGIRVSDLLAALGPEVVLLDDQAGQAVAVRLRDADAFARSIDALAAKHGLTRYRHVVNGRSIEELDIGAIFDTVEYREQDPQARLIAELFFMPDRHLFWSRENDYLVLAKVPQILIDRDYYPATPVGVWLLRNHGPGAERALLLMNKNMRGVPRAAYHAHLSWLQTLADLGDIRIDLAKLPTARELQLPESSNVGVHLSVQDRVAALDLRFASTPLDLMYGSDTSTMTTVAVIGILAAVAIPAYQDYTLRAKIAQSLAATAPLKAEIRDYWYARGAFPGGDQVDTDAVYYGTPDEVVAVEVDPDGSIRLSLSNVGGQSGEILLRPRVAGNDFEWECSSSLPGRYLPADCR